MGLLSLVATVLLINHIVIQVIHYQLDAGSWVLMQMFDVDDEENFPTFYSALVLLICSALLYAITLRKNTDKDPFRRHWQVLSLVFFAMAVDEVAGMHEAMNTLIDFSWTIPAFIAVVIFAASYLRFLIHLPVPTRIGFLLAGSLFFGGAIGVEHVTDWYLEVRSMDTLGYNLLTAVEEGLEMFGAVFFVNTLLRYMAQTNHLKFDLRVI